MLLLALSLDRSAQQPTPPHPDAAHSPGTEPAQQHAHPAGGSYRLRPRKASSTAAVAVASGVHAVQPSQHANEAECSQGPVQQPAASNWLSDALPPRKRPRTATSLASSLVRTLAEGLAANIDAVSECCLLSLCSAAMDHIRSEGTAVGDAWRQVERSGQDASAQSPAQAVLEIVLECLAGNRSALAARMEVCVRPCWDGREFDENNMLQGLGIRVHGRTEVRCLMRVSLPLQLGTTPGGHFASVCVPYGSEIQFDLGGRHLRMHVGLTFAVKDHVSLCVLITLDVDWHDEESDSEQDTSQQYLVEVSAVGEEELQLLATGGQLRDSKRRCRASWTALVEEGPTRSGPSMWARAD